MKTLIGVDNFFILKQHSCSPLKGTFQKAVYIYVPLMGLQGCKLITIKTLHSALRTHNSIPFFVLLQKSGYHHI